MINQKTIFTGKTTYLCAETERIVHFGTQHKFQKNMRKNLLFLFAGFLLATASCKNNSLPSTFTTENHAAIPTGSDASSAPSVHNIETNLNGHDALETIKKACKGKVALIDFWATWCPPCRAALREIDQIKPDLEKKGAIFVYVTDESSPAEEWRNSLSTIHGEHYRLTEKQFREIQKELNMRGIPSYMLLDKNGKVAFSNTEEGGYPGNEMIKHLMDNALK